MAGALIGALTASRLVKPANITASDTRKEQLVLIKKKNKIKIAINNSDTVKNSDIIFLAVKPQQMEALLKDTGHLFHHSQIVISIAAGITTSYIEKFMPENVCVIRVMPNTPALIGAGASVVCGGKNAGQKQMRLAEKLLSTAGLVVEIDERQINSVTALSGSGPAYVFYIAELLEQAGIEMGLPQNISSALARQTVYGAGNMLQCLPDTAARLRQNVTSPGGTTEAALNYLATKKFDKIFIQAVHRAQKKAEELSK